MDASISYFFAIVKAKVRNLPCSAVFNEIEIVVDSGYKLCIFARADQSFGMPNFWCAKLPTGFSRRNRCQSHWNTESIETTDDELFAVAQN